MRSRGRRTTLILPVPAAERAVNRLRMEHDHWAARGVPAHITVVSPFLDAHAISSAVLERLQGVLAAVAAPEVRLTDARRMGGVVYLAPEAAAPLRDVSRAVEEAWSEVRRLGRRTYHLTVARRQGPREGRRLAADLSSQLPIHCRLSDATLLSIGGAERPALLGRFRVGSTWSPPFDSRYLRHDPA